MTRSDDTYPEAQDAPGGSSAANDIPGRTWHVTPDLPTVVTADGEFQSVNPAWLTTFGWSAADVERLHF